MATVLERDDITRTVYLTDDEFDLLHDLMSSPPDVDVVIDIAGMSVDEQTTAIRDVWKSATQGGHEIGAE